MVDQSHGMWIVPPSASGLRGFVTSYTPRSLLIVAMRYSLSPGTETKNERFAE